jgi:hypothetical protein
MGSSQDAVSIARENIEFVEVDGVSYAYRTSGQPSSVPLVLLQHCGRLGHRAPPGEWGLSLPPCPQRRTSAFGALAGTELTQTARDPHPLSGVVAGKDAGELRDDLP